MPLRMVEPAPQQTAVSDDLLPVWQAVYQLRKQEAKVLQPGMLHAQPLWGGIAVMDKTQFKWEKERGAAIAIARQMLHRKLITPEEYQKLTQVLTQEQHPEVNHSPV